MSKKSMFTGIFLVFTILMTGVQVFAVDEKELERQSDLIAKLLFSCRAIIAQNQDLFNDPEKGDKGFTGDVYISKASEHFKNTTGIEVSESDASSTDPVKKMLGTLLVSSKKIIDENQKVLNIWGLGFKGVISAVIGRRTSHLYTKAMGAGYRLKQTSMKYRNPANRPDAFESRILTILSKEAGYPKDKGIGEVITYSDGTKVYRYMLPLFIEQECLQCHGDPKGERDITGRVKEGYRLGELRGAISVMVPYP
jgi:general secretion pathway protein A